MSMTRSFQRTSVTVDHKTLPAYAITCNECGKQDTLMISKSSNTLPVDMINRKFSTRGWFVGNRVRDDRCPACRASGRPQRKHCEAQVIDMAKLQKELPTEIAALAAIPVADIKRADPPPVMEREDRRIIFAEIDAHYLDEQKGYDNDWNDARVAKGLNVPLAWVRQICEDNFGPEVGTKIIDEMKKLDEIIDRATKAAERLDALRAEIKKERHEIDLRYDSVSKEAEEARAAVLDLVQRVTDLNKRIS